MALEAGEVCWCISKRSSEVSVTLLSVTRVCCCLKVPENNTFQQVKAISGLSLSDVPAPMTSVLSSSSNMILCKSCVPGKDSHCYHYVACITEDCLHSFCTQFCMRRKVHMPDARGVLMHCCLCGIMQVAWCNCLCMGVWLPPGDDTSCITGLGRDSHAFVKVSNAQLYSR